MTVIIPLHSYFMLFCHSLLASVLLLALCPSFPSALSPPPSSPFSPLLESSSNSVMHWCPSPSGVSTLLISNFNQNMKAHEWPPGSTQSKWPLDMLLSRQVAGLSFQDVKSLLWWHYTFACGFNQARMAPSHCFLILLKGDISDN